VKYIEVRVVVSENGQEKVQSIKIPKVLLAEDKEQYLQRATGEFSRSVLSAIYNSAKIDEI